MQYLLEESCLIPAGPQKASGKLRKLSWLQAMSEKNQKDITRNIIPSERN